MKLLIQSTIYIPLFYKNKLKVEKSNVRWKHSNIELNDTIMFFFFSLFLIRTMKLKTTSKKLMFLFFYVNNTKLVNICNIFIRKIVLLRQSVESLGISSASSQIGFFAIWSLFVLIIKTRKVHIEHLARWDSKN